MSVEDSLNPGERDRLIGATLILLASAWQSWIQRRVERIEIIDEATIRHSISVQFTIPDLSGEAWLERSVAELSLPFPIAVLQKGPLRGFSLRDEAGWVVPLSAREQTAHWSYTALLLLAEIIQETVDPTMRKNLQKLVDVDNAGADGAYNCLKSLWESSPDNELPSEAQKAIAALAQTLKNGFLLLVTLPYTPGVERVIKIVYETDFTDSKKRPREGKSRFSDSFTSFVQSLRYVDDIVLPLPGLGLAVSSHVVMDAPRGLAFPESLPPKQKSIDLKTVPDAVRIYSHRYPPGNEARFIFSLYLAHDRFLHAAVLACSLTTVLLGSGIGLRLVGAHDDPGSTTAVVVFLPTVFAAFVAERFEHPLVAKLMRGPRYAVILSTFVSLAAAASLGLTLPDSWRPVPVRLLFWGVLSILSLASLLYLVWLHQQRSR